MSEAQINLSKVTMAMAVAFGVLFSLNSLCTCIVASMTNSTWSDMSTEKRLILAIAIMGNWTTLLMAYLSKTVARLEAGKPPIDTGDTSMFQRSESRQFQAQNLALGQTQTETKLEVKTTEVKPSE